MTAFRIKPEIVRQRRKTAVIRIYPDNRVLVAVPYFMKDTSISNFIYEKEDWIKKHFKINSEKLSRRIERNYEQGETFYYLGKAYKLHLNPTYTRGVTLDRNILWIDYVATDPNSIPKQIVTWFKNQAQDIISDRVELYRRKIRRNPVELKFRKMKSRWGSCSSKGIVTFNTTLIMAPLAVIDYIVVHELCHLVHHNHSASFWRLVERIMPDYQVHEKWLKDNGFLLLL